MQTKRYSILGVEVHAIAFDEAISTVLVWGKQKSQRYICFANVHMTIEARNDPSFMQVVNHADLVLADGKPLAKAVEWLYNKKQERIAGMDFLPAIIEAASKDNSRIFLLGSTDNLLQKVAGKIKNLYGEQVLAGAYSPPFRSLSDTEEAEISLMINQSNANLVLVALGCPKQERWMARNFKNINAPLLGLGGAFTVYAEMQKRSPKWMQEAGLEWLYRLVQEPRRLFKRYFTTNSQFMLQLIVELSKKARV